MEKCSRMKFAYLGLLLLILTQTSSRGLKLSKRVVDLLQEVIDASKESDDASDDELLDLTEDVKVDKVKEVKKKDELAPKKANKLSQKISNLLQDVMDESRGNATLQDDVDEILDKHHLPTKVPKKDHPNKCGGSAFDEAVDKLAEIVKEGIEDKLTDDFKHKFDESEEEIYKKIRKDASARPWWRRRFFNPRS